MGGRGGGIRLWEGEKSQERYKHKAGRGGEGKEVHPERFQRTKAP